MYKESPIEWCSTRYSTVQGIPHRVVVVVIIVCLCLRVCVCVVDVCVCVGVSDVKVVVGRYVYM